MSEAKFTKGPWHCHRNTSFWEFGCDERGQLGDVCASAFTPEGRAPDAEETMEANAHLIASAPELYEALRMAAKDLNTAAHFLPDTGLALLETVKQAHAALAKARGEA
ncbi:hypothetical protein [Gluconobacter cerinus]|uniref:hypothetical protein n=1 Tax=Gluconobacter cerinus TaxID=38307 RepID=UPI001B8CF013|nr:hypothetical protein [Gluconobacter cerinus]MBS1035025.1 hypothetical protein [Gluconobacter cerinus]